MVTWPSRAVAAIQKLFEPLQDIDVFVEDANDEVFYSHLLRRVSTGADRVVRVFALGGREAVIKAAREHQSSGRRALYLIDGDLDWVLGSPAPQVPRLFRLSAYCIENLLVTESAAQRLVIEEAGVSLEDAASRLRFIEWLDEITEPLVELFAAFAAARHYANTEAPFRWASAAFTQQTNAAGCQS